VLLGRLLPLLLLLLHLQPYLLQQHSAAPWQVSYPLLNCRLLLLLTLLLPHEWLVHKHSFWVTWSGDVGPGCVGSMVAGWRAWCVMLWKLECTHCMHLCCEYMCETQRDAGWVGGRCRRVDA
jgi:hypothetical protein